MIRDKKHLKFLRTLPCCVCLRMDTVQAAHLRKDVPLEHKGGMGMKPSDCYTVPLCYECHNRQHNIGEITFWDINIHKAICLAIELFNDTGKKEKAIHRIIGFNRVLRSKK